MEIEPLEDHEGKCDFGVMVGLHVHFLSSESYFLYSCNLHVEVKQNIFFFSFSI